MPKEAKNINKPYVVVFGDKEQGVTKVIWSLLSSHELQLANVSDIDELDEMASGAVLILIAIQGLDDKNTEIALKLAHNPRVVADVIAVTEDAGVDERLKILAMGFDAIFNLDFMDYPDFKTILLNRVEKGFISLENRIQQEEYRRFKASLAASPDAFIVFDENNKLFFVSEHYKKAYPLTGHRLVRGMDVMDAFVMCSEEQGVTEADPRFKGMQSFWSSMDGEVEFQNEERIWHIKAKKLPDGQGTIVTTTDITRYKNEQHQLEEKSENLSEALTKEQEASAIQKQFINMVSHEFRTPLSIIDGNAQILFRRARTIDEDTIQQRSRTIRSAVSRLVNMMEGVLSSNMLKTGKLDIVREPLDLGKLIQELCDEHADLSTKHDIKCDIERLPKECVLDRKLMTLVISNMLSNAIKFTRDDPVISVKGWQENETIYLEFIDNGIGIPENEIDKIFKRFYRTTIASGISGSGIGLNLAKDLIEMHGGKIEVESKVGEGTKFVISIPAEVY